MDKAQAERLLQAGKAMRQAQKQYARNRNMANTREKNDAERKFDEVLSECAKGAPQCTLFNT